MALNIIFGGLLAFLFIHTFLYGFSSMGLEFLYVVMYVPGWIVFSLFLKFIKYIAFYEKTYVNDKPEIPLWWKNVSWFSITLLVILLATPMGVGIVTGTIMWLAIDSWFLFLSIVLTPLGWLSVIVFGILTSIIYHIKKKLQCSKMA